MEMVFKARPGFRFRTSPEVVGSHIERLKAEAGGKLMPEAVVADGVDPRSAIHDEFRDVLDDAECGRRLRIHRAETLMGSYVRVVLEDDGTETESLGNVRVVERAESPEGGPALHRYYTSPELAFRDPDQRARIFAEAERGVAGYQERLRLLRVADAADLKFFDRVRRAMRRQARRRPQPAARAD